MVNGRVWSQSNYLAPYDYLLDANIVEYDISKANISVLYSRRAISDETYYSLLDIPKKLREVTIGRMIRREPILQEILAAGIMDSRRQLFEFLNLNDNMILAIKNDAVFVAYSKNAMPVIRPVQIDNYIQFIPKGKYNSFYKILRKEFYYAYDPTTNSEGLDIKGVGEYGIYQCESFINLLCDIFNLVLLRGPKIALHEANIIYRNFMSKTYPIEFYRRLDSHAKFDIDIKSEFSKFQSDMLGEEDKYAVDTSYNGMILRTVIGYLTENVIH